MARTDLEQLQFQMSADISKMQKQLKTALDQVNDTSDKMDKRLGKVGEGANVGKALDSIFDRSRLAVLDEGGARLKVFGSSLEYLGPAGIAAAAGLAALGIGLEEAKKAAEYADSIYKLAENAHVSTDALQELQYAVRQAGGNEDEAAKGLQRFSEMLGRAQEGMPRALKQFQALGFTPDQVKSWKDAETALPIIAASIANLKSTSLKDAAIAGLGLDTSDGNGLRLLIEQGPAGMAKLRAEAEAAGQVMDSHLVAKGHELNEEMETLDRKISIDLKSAFVELGPVLVKLLGFIAQMADKAVVVADALSPMEARSTKSLQREARAFDARSNSPESYLFGGPQADRDRAARARAELARRKAAGEDQPQNAPTGSGDLKYPTKAKGPTAADKLAKGQEALDAAQQAELTAQQALTDNVEEIAALKIQEVDRETAKKDTQLRQEIADGKINTSLAEQAIAENDKAALLKKQLIERQAAEKDEDQFFAVQKEVAQVYDQIASIYASMATTVEARLQIERAALLQRQKEERDALQREFERQKAHNNFDQSRADMQTATQRDQQAAQLAELNHGAIKDLAGDFQTLLGGAVDALENHKNVMVYLADAFRDRMLSNLVEIVSQYLAKLALNAPQGSFLNMIGQVFGHRASGGGVSGGLPYEVGESGPEVFVPGVNGSILSNKLLNSRVGGGRGATVLNMTINAPGAMMAQEWIDYVESAKVEAVQLATTRSVAASAVIVPARMAKANYQRYR